MKKFVSIILVLSMLLAGLTCLAEENEYVELKMILLGDKPEDCDMVYERVNEILKEKANATLDVEFYGWGDWQQKYPLAFASGEKFDLIYTSSWAFYNEQASKGGFLEITDEMLQEYAPQTWENVSEGEWSQALFDGKRYMIPMSYMASLNHDMAIIRGDLREKYGLPEVTDLEGYINYLETIAENNDPILGFNCGGSDAASRMKVVLVDDLYDYRALHINGIETGFFIDYKATEEKGELVLINPLENENVLNGYEKMRELRELGVWSQNTLSNSTTVEEAFENGASASYVRPPLNVGQMYSTVSLAHPEWKPEIVDLFNGKNITEYAQSVISDGMGIHVTSENPERALMVLDLLRYDKELNDLTTLGIEGVHWEAIGDTKYAVLEDAPKFPADGACPWGWKTALYRSDANCPDAVQAIFDKLQVEGYTTPIMMFNFDVEPVKNEAAAVSTLSSEYIRLISSGFADDVKGTLTEYIDMANKAGLQKVLDEYTKQANEFLQSYGK